MRTKNAERSNSADRTGSKAARYLIATAVGAPANVLVYLLLARRAGLPEAVANLVAALLIMGPRFMINKYWVWRHRDRTRVGFEARVHLALTLLGLALSTLVAWRLGRAGSPSAVLAAGNIASFAAVWLVRFAVFNYLVFRPVPTASDLPERPSEEALVAGSGLQRVEPGTEEHVIDVQLPIRPGRRSDLYAGRSRTERSS